MPLPDRALIAPEAIGQYPNGAHGCEEQRDEKIGEI